ncbi:MAG: LytTR family transcriptional regulator DNA-binding domain-containing protein, partial [Bacteroidales bacterium]
MHFRNRDPITCVKLLKNFESVLTMNFIRIHRSCLVNISYITKIIDHKFLEV